jgi:hypothetical protein
LLVSCKFSGSIPEVSDSALSLYSAALRYPILGLLTVEVELQI